ncbi:hypothetical protein MUP59_08235 [Candidatus Bathyarchaeota archaeon]|nr:hypothetical protein [Candidatus Bathyarchaeota archaeon]
MPTIEGGNVGATARELGARQCISEGCAQHHLRAEVEKGRYDCGMGWRYSPVLKRDYRAMVYWLKEKMEE